MSTISKFKRSFSCPWWSSSRSLRPKRKLTSNRRLRQRPNSSCTSWARLRSQFRRLWVIRVSRNRSRRRSRCTRRATNKTSRRRLTKPYRRWPLRTLSLRSRMCRSKWTRSSVLCFRLGCRWQRCTDCSNQAYNRKLSRQSMMLRSQHSWTAFWTMDSGCSWSWERSVDWLNCCELGDLMVASLA